MDDVRSKLSGLSYLVDSYLRVPGQPLERGLSAFLGDADCDRRRQIANEVKYLIDLCKSQNGLQVLDARDVLRSMFHGIDCTKEKPAEVPKPEPQRPWALRTFVRIANAVEYRLTRSSQNKTEIVRPQTPPQSQTDWIEVLSQIHNTVRCWWDDDNDDLELVGG
jgi:hypothetical protein